MLEHETGTPTMHSVIHLRNSNIDHVGAAWGRSFNVQRCRALLLPRAHAQGVKPSIESVSRRCHGDLVPPYPWY